jgi:LPS O-antigen subunit length determinant protein (WzzB/FepE family)
MTDAAIDLHDFINAFYNSIPAHIHPMAQGACRGYVQDMHDAVNAGDMAEFARLVKIAKDKIASEIEWEEDKARSAADPKYIPRRMRG